MSKSETEKPRGQTKRTNPFINRATSYLLAVAPTGEAIIGAELFSKGEFSSGIKNWVGDRLFPPPTNPFAPKENGAFIQVYDRGLEDAIRVSLRSYQEWQGYSQVVLQSGLKERQSKETLEVMEQMAKNTIIGGVNLLRTAWILGHIEDKVDIDQSYTSVWINSQNYSLKDRFQTHLANAWMQTKLSYVGEIIRFGDLHGKNEAVQRRLLELDEKAKLLEWFRSVSPQVNFKERSYAFFPQWEMVNMARIFKTVYDQGYTLPQRVNYCGAECFEDGYLGLARPNLNTAEIKNELFATFTLAHEMGHLVSYQEDLVGKFTNIRGVVGADSVENKLYYVSDYARTASKEDFAETFAKYLIEGNHFCLTLEQLRLHKPEAYTALSRKYEFMKTEVFNGVEFSSSAERRNPESEKQEQKFGGIKVFMEQGNRIEIRPDLTAIPGGEFSSTRLPILVDDHFVDVWVSVRVEIGNQGRAYYISIDSNAGLIPELVLYPFVGDEKIRIFYQREWGIPDESLDAIRINLQDYNKRTGGNSFGGLVYSLPNTDGS